MNIKFFLLFALLLILYIAILSFNLLKLPLYLDEGLYIFWSYLFSQDPTYAYVSMQDGKTPLFIWITAWINPLFNDFLFSARFISVIASAVSTLCWSIICAKILGRKNAYLFFIIVLITPYSILIGRLAFVDSLLIAFGSLSFLSVFLLKEFASKAQILRSLFFAAAAGFFLGLAFFTKTTAKLFLASEILVVIIWIFQFLRNRRFKTVFLLTIGGLIVIGFYFEMMGYLKFGALRHWEMIANKESILVFSLPELYRKFFVEHNFSTHLKNINITLEYLFFYFGPILFFFAAGIIWMIKVRKHFWILFLVTILSSGVFLSAKIPASRYLAITIPEVLIISMFGLHWIWQKNSILLKTASVILLIISGYLSFKMILTPLNAYYSGDDQANFVDNNLNALGLNESVRFLESKKDTSAVGVIGIWGVAEGAQVAFKEKGIETYTPDRVVTIRPKENFCEKDYKELGNNCWKIDFGDITNSKKSEKYIYFNEQIDIEALKELENIEVVKEFKRPRTNLNVYLIKISP